MKYVLILFAAIGVAALAVALTLPGEDSPKAPPATRPDPSIPPDPEDEAKAPETKDPRIDDIEWEREQRRKMTAEQLQRWKEMLDKENDRRIAELATLLSLSANDRKLVSGFFNKERENYDRIWKEILELPGSRRESWQKSDRYRIQIEKITTPTDNQMRYVLDKETFAKYTEWRKKYNEGRYFWRIGAEK